MLRLRVLEFLSHFLGFIIAKGPVALRTNHGNKPAGLNSLFDALPHARMDQRYECFSAELTSRPFSVSDFRNIFTHHEQTRGKDIYKKRVLPFALPLALNFVRPCGSLSAKSACRAEVTKR